MRAKIAIIGTAGRKEDGERLNLSKFNLMKSKAREYILSDLGIDFNEICLVSGGAAWADHIAVSLFLEHPELQLKLYLPAEYSMDDAIFKVATTNRMDPGKIANYYHQLFKDNTKIRSLMEIRKAIQKGADIEVYPGFMERNLLVANSCDYMIAFTFGEDGVKDGGTKHTWDASSAQKIHFPIQDL